MSRTGSEDSMVPKTFEPILLTREKGSVPFSANPGLTRPLSFEPDCQSLQAYQDEGGYEALKAALSRLSPQHVLCEIEAAQLRGRGGARFPTARKWRLAAEQSAAEKYVIANGGEHEPGSHKDAVLISRYPHKIIEGLLLCGYATGASQGYLYIIESTGSVCASAQKAIDEASDAGFLGNSILNQGFSFSIEIHVAPETYVAGEETAALDAIEGGAGKPREKPPYPGQSGLFGCPTTVNNVETLAHVPSIIRRGAAWYSRFGTQHSKGTMLFTLGDDVNRPGVYELPFGATYRHLIFECGAGPVRDAGIRAILPAMSCAFLDAAHLDRPIAYESLSDLKTSPGCGGVRLILDDEDVVERVVEIARFFKQAQCGLCPPCRMETNQFVHILEGVSAGKRGDFAGQLNKIADFARGKGRCSLIEMASAPVLSGANLFHSDFVAKAHPD